MSSHRPSANSVALAGEFAVLSQLALRGFDANLTLGHTKHVDILVSDPASGRMFKLEVKTRYRDRAHAGTRSKLFGHALEWLMSQKHEDISDPSLFYCFVSLAAGPDTLFRFFIVPSAVVAQYVRDQHRVWLAQDSSRKDTPMRVFRLGLDEGGYPLATPLAENYENNWKFRR